MKEQYIAQVLHACGTLFPEANALAVADLESFVLVSSQDKDFSVLRELSLSAEPVTYRALKEEKRVEAVGELSGLMYEAISIPLHVDEVLVGALTAFFTPGHKQNAMPYVTVRTRDRWLPLHYDDVVFMEARHRKTHVTSRNGIGTHRNNLTELEETLPKDIFMRCHRSYIINVHHVKEIHPDSHATFVLLMTDQSRVPVSQNFTKRIRAKFGF